MGQSMQALDEYSKLSEDWVNLVQNHAKGLALQQGGIRGATDALHFDKNITDLNDLDKLFGDMCIDIHSEDIEDLDLDKQIANVASDHQRELRESSIEVARLHGQFWQEKILRSFMAFKSDELNSANHKRERLKDDLNYNLIMKKMHMKRDLLKKIEGDVIKKQSLLAEKKEEENMSPEAIRKKYETSVLETRVKVLVNRIEDQNKEMETTTTQQKKLESEIRISRINLADVLFLLEKNEAKLAGTSNCGIIKEEDNHNESHENEMYLQQVSKLEGMISNNMLITENILSTEKKIIEIKNEFDKFAETGEKKKLQRLKLSCSSDENAITLEQAAAMELKYLIRTEFGIENFDSKEGMQQIDQMLNKRKERDFRNEMLKKARLDALFNLDASSNDVVIDINRPVRTMTELNSQKSRQTINMLKKTFHVTGTELLKASDRKVSSVLFASTEKISCTKNDSLNHSNITNNSLDPSNIAKNSILAIDESENLLQDFGLQAIGEQLNVLDNLLRDGSRKHVIAAKSQTGFNDIQSIRHQLQTIVSNIGAQYHQTKKLTKQLKIMEGNVDDLKTDRDYCRSQFLMMNKERSELPKRIGEREIELDYLARRIPDLHIEIAIVQKSIQEKKEEIESKGDEAKSRIKNTTFLHNVAHKEVNVKNDEDCMTQIKDNQTRNGVNNVLLQGNEDVDKAKMDQQKENTIKMKIANTEEFVDSPPSVVVEQEQIEIFANAKLEEKAFVVYPIIPSTNENEEEEKGIISESMKFKGEKETRQNIDNAESSLSTKTAIVNVGGNDETELDTREEEKSLDESSLSTKTAIVNVGGNDETELEARVEEKSLDKSFNSVAGSKYQVQHSLSIPIHNVTIEKKIHEKILVSCRRPNTLKPDSKMENMHFGGHHSSPSIPENFLYELPPAYRHLVRKKESEYNMIPTLPGDPLQLLKYSKKNHVKRLRRLRERVVAISEKRRADKKHEQRMLKFFTNLSSELDLLQDQEIIGDEENDEDFYAHDRFLFSSDKEEVFNKAMAKELDRFSLKYK